MNKETKGKGIVGTTVALLGVTAISAVLLAVNSQRGSTVSNVTNNSVVINVGGELTSNPTSNTLVEQYAKGSRKFTNIVRGEPVCLNSCGNVVVLKGDKPSFDEQVLLIDKKIYEDVMGVAKETTSFNGTVVSQSKGGQVISIGNTKLSLSYSLTPTLEDVGSVSPIPEPSGLLLMLGGLGLVGFMAVRNKFKGEKK